VPLQIKKKKHGRSFSIVEKTISSFLHLICTSLFHPRWSGFSMQDSFHPGYFKSYCYKGFICM